MIFRNNVTADPTTEWTGQQLREAFPFEEVPRYLLHDRDGIFGADFTKEVRNLGIEEVLSAPHSPWQRAYIERVIGSIRHECLDHVIVFNEASLYRHLISFWRITTTLHTAPPFYVAEKSRVAWFVVGIAGACSPQRTRAINFAEESSNTLRWNTQGPAASGWTSLGNRCQCVASD